MVGPNGKRSRKQASPVGATGWRSSDDGRRGGRRRTRRCEAATSSAGPASPPSRSRPRRPPPPPPTRSGKGRGRRRRGRGPSRRPSAPATRPRSARDHRPLDDQLKATRRHRPVPAGAPAAEAGAAGMCSRGRRCGCSVARWSSSAECSRPCGAARRRR